MAKITEDNIINFDQVSRLLTGNRAQISANRIGKKYQPEVEELRTFVRLWIARNQQKS